MNRFPAGEEIRVSYTCAAGGAAKETVACPKPRRVGQIHKPCAIRPLRRHFSHQLEICEAGNELLDIIHPKGGGVTDESFTHIASSPPFFSGSPPSRVSNPLIHDIRFGDEKVAPIICPRAIPTEIPAYSKSSTARKASGSCVWANFGNNPAVRVEGFDCLDRDSRNCSISTLA